MYLMKACSLKNSSLSRACIHRRDTDTLFFFFLGCGDGVGVGKSRVDLGGWGFDVWRLSACLQLKGDKLKMEVGVT